MSPQRFAIIGLGPRGLGALEALLRAAPPHPIEVTLFDPTPWPGAGPNFSPDEDPLCLLNLPVREVRFPELPAAALAQPSAAGLGDFAQWAGMAPDIFPPRAVLGAYLTARLAHVTAKAGAACRIRRSTCEISHAKYEDGRWVLTTPQGDQSFDEVALCLGQPPAKPDPQRAAWQEHAQRSGAVFLDAYPGRELAEKGAFWAGKTVALRGLGLSTLDVVRVLSLGLGGRFEAGRYIRSGNEPARIVPFSLSGHAPVPKPETAALDASFDPRDTEISAFDEALAAALRAPSPEAALDGICAALTPAVSRLWDGPEGAIAQWLATERESAGAQDTRSTTQALRETLAEARGEVPPSLGYVIGQVWRKYQDRMRHVFNLTLPAPDIASAVIGFDEGLKRFSYGPPVLSCAHLLGLIEAGLVDPRAADDPDLRLTDAGWELSEGETLIRAGVMIDAVLPGPDLATLRDDLAADLYTRGLLTQRVEGMGARLDETGAVIGAPCGLSVLGRLGHGSLIGADSVPDAFGEQAARWAKAALSRGA